MARIRLLVQLADGRGVWRKGDLYECDAAEAKRLIAAGVGERVKARPFRKAVGPLAERATVEGV